MSQRKSRNPDTRSILSALSSYQNQAIIPHCPSCRRPCCNLTDVVLEFDWRHLRELYQIELGQKAFDRSLQDGSAPIYIRKQADLYYTHGSPCPAYDALLRQCRVYQSRLKPDNCSDFPLYLDGHTIVADTRCEALDVNNLLGSLAEAFPARQFSSRPDPDFPILIYIEFR